MRLHLRSSGLLPACSLAALSMACSTGSIHVGDDTDQGDCPVVELGATSLSWVDAAWNGPNTQFVQVRNACTAGADLVLTGISVQGSAAFSVGVTELTLAPGDVVEVAVDYQPTDYGPEQGNLLFQAQIPGAPVGYEVSLIGRADPDRDGDGHDAAILGGFDCDDTDASVYPGAPEELDLVDDDCDGLVDEDFVEAGDAFVSELMTSPKVVPTSVGQWFEVRNVSGHDLDLIGWRVGSDDGDGFVIEQSLVVRAGRQVAFATSGDASENGGLIPGYVYTWDAFQLSNRGDSVALYVEDLEVSRLAYEESWGIVAGRSLSLDPIAHTAVAAQAARWWCSASSPMPAGDLGTPGTVNDWCGTVDHDGDGYTPDEGDCDDTNADVNPDGSEVWDGADNDCNGLTDDLQVDQLAQGYVDGSGTYDRLPYPGQLGVGDVDDDGRDEIMVGSNTVDYYGAVFVLDAESYASFNNTARREARAEFLSSTYMNTWWSVGPEMGDNTGNGYVNLAVGGARYGTFGYADLGLYQDWQISGSMDAEDAYIRFSGAGGTYNAAVSVHSGLDMTGDGTAELIYGNTSFSTNRGRVWVLQPDGFTPDDYSLEDAEAIYKGTGAQKMLGSTMGGGDVDGDGYDDLIVRELAGGTASGDGAYYLIYGAATISEEDDVDDVATVNWNNVDSVVNAIGTGTHPQVADLDDDGAMDVVLSNSGSDVVSVFYSAAALSGVVHVERDADTTIDGTSTGANSHFGYSIETGDFTGDGVADLAIGRPNLLPTTPAVGKPGAVYLFAGGSRWAASLKDTDASASLVGSDDNDAFGIGLLATDLDGDGKSDLVVGAPLYGGANTYYAPGRVWFVPLP